MEKYSEEEIIQMAQNDDGVAVDFILKKYKGLVRKKARSLFLMGGDQDDLIQEGMIGLLKAIRNFDVTKETSFSTYADVCITSQMYSAIKSSNRMKNIPLNTYISIYAPAHESAHGDGEGNFMIDASIESAEKSPEEILINRESMDSMREKLLTRLSKMEKEVFEYYMSGMTYQEIARVMGKEPKAIDNALQRIKGKVSR